MADYPCDVHLTRYSGPSHRAYLNVYREDEEIKLKASVCGDCLAVLVTDWLGKALHQTPAGTWDPAEDDEDLAALWRPVRPRLAPLNGYRRV